MFVSKSISLRGDPCDTKRLISFGWLCQTLLFVHVRIEVSDAELEEMDFSSVEEFEEQIRDQLVNGVVTSDGGTGSEWMAEYELEVIKVD